MNRRYRGDVQLIFGPPARPDERRIFDEAQEALHAKDWARLEFYDTLVKDYFRDLLTCRGDQPAIFDEVFSMALGRPVRIASFFLGEAYVERQWLPSLSLERKDVLFAEGQEGDFPPDGETAHTICAMLGYLLRRDWVHWMATLDEEEADLELPAADPAGL